MKNYAHKAAAKRKAIMRDKSKPIEERRAAFRAHNRALNPEHYNAPGKAGR